MKLKKFQGNPIVSPDEKNDWESLVTCNPGVYYDNGIFYMLYRAAGNDDEHVIRLGLATSKDGFHFERASEQPVFGPGVNNFDSGCVEDPRIVKFDNEYYVTYAYRPFPPGQYWKFAHDVVKIPKVGADAPAAIAKNLGNTGLAVTTDFKNFRRLGRLTSPVLDDRDVIIFPEKINGQYVLMHRPKQYIGERYGVKYPSIWLKFSDDLLDWEDKESHLLLTGIEGTWEEKIGGSTPPLKTEYGWLVIYHGVENGGLGYYRAGAILLDLENPLKIISKAPDFILEPEYDYEIEGYYKGCVFPTGNVIVDDTLYVYYGGADKYIGVATCNIHDFIKTFKKV
ncbi:glycosidase [Dysgonomonas sp. 521]|uniref:glycoside hydrolase family 130 protein n=1 Tax=Dysgonomonas sp. 521 TaxID=2302932 RepID=UPI0013D78840|nr:glycosidase [Dysgonomonas sp. 521]NDV93986.1 glycosidase [Dysgonomonas sp. 521]